MVSFKKLEMVDALSTDSRIVIRKSLFSQKVYYQLTQSELVANVLEYAPEAGARLEQLLALPHEKMLAELQQHGSPKSTPVGQYRLEAVQSRDGHFAAVQLFRFADFVYHKASEPIICEGNDVAIISLLIG